MARLAIFVDGGYIAKIAQDHLRIRVDFEKLSHAIRDTIAGTTGENLDLLRTYFYDCLPYQSNPPTPDETRRFGRRRSFFAALQRLPMYKVRQGRLVYRGRDDQGNPFFQQKRVDLMLGLDVAALAAKHQIQYAAVVAGDSDLMPAIEAAQAEGIAVWLVHGPRNTYASELWEAADNRLSVADPRFIQAIQSDRRR